VLAVELRWIRGCKTKGLGGGGVTEDMACMGGTDWGWQQLDEESQVRVCRHTGERQGKAAGVTRDV
jgi:hypothetical protein